jgi:hypothetical protein
MEEKYLQNLTDSAKKELRNYSLYAQDFGLINTFFIKNNSFNQNWRILLSFKPRFEQP